MIHSVTYEDSETKNKEIVMCEHEFKLFSDGFLDGEIGLKEINKDVYFLDDDDFFENDECLSDSLMREDSNDIEHSDKTGSLTASQDMESRLKIDNTRRRYKNFTPIPKVPKCDVRRNYAKMYANVTNSNDIRATEGFFNTFALKNMVFTLHDMSRKTPRKMEMNGLSTVLQFWFDRYAMDTDGIMTLNNSQVYFYADSKESKVTWNFTFKATCSFDIPYNIEYQAHARNVAANGGNGNARYDVHAFENYDNSDVSLMESADVSLIESADSTSFLKSTTKSTGKRKNNDATSNQSNIIASKCSATTSNNDNSSKNGNIASKNNDSSVQSHAVASTTMQYDTMVEKVMQKAPLLSQPMEMLVTGMTTMYLNSNKEITKQDTTVFSARTKPIEKCF